MATAATPLVEKFEQSVTQGQEQSSLLHDYLDVVDTIQKIVDVSANVIGVVLSYVGKGITFGAKVLAYPVVLIVGGAGLLMWQGVKLTVAGFSFAADALNGVLNR